MTTPHHTNNAQLTNPGASYEKDPTIWGSNPYKSREYLRAAIAANFHYLENVGPDVKAAAAFIGSGGLLSDLSISKELVPLVQLTAAMNEAMEHSLTWITDNYPMDVEKERRFFSTAASKSATAVLGSARALEENPNANLLRTVAPAARQTAVDLREEHVSSIRGKARTWKPRRIPNAGLRDPNKEFLSGLQRSANAGIRQGSRVQSLLPKVDELHAIALTMINRDPVSNQISELAVDGSRADSVPSANSTPVQQPKSATAA